MGVGALAGFAGGLESGFQNYQQSQQNTQELQSRKLQNQEEQQKLAAGSLPFYQLRAQQDPSVLADPNFINALNKPIVASGGIPFDATKPLPKNFATPGFFFNDSASFARTRQMGIDSFNNNLTRIMAAKDVPPAARIQTIMTLAQTNGLDPSEAISGLESSGAVAQWQQSYTEQGEALAARTGLSVEKVREGAARLPYEIQNMAASAAYKQAGAANFGSLADWRSQRLVQMQDALTHNDRLSDAKIAVDLADIKRKGAQATVEDRNKTAKTLLDAANQRRQIGNTMAAEIINRPSSMDALTPEQYQDGMKKANDYLDSADALAQEAKNLGTGPAYKPAPLAPNQRIDPQHPLSAKMLDTTKVYFITAGPNKGMYVHNGQMGRKGDAKSVKPYTPSPGDKYTLTTLQP